MRGVKLPTASRKLAVQLVKLSVHSRKLCMRGVKMNMHCKKLPTPGTKRQNAKAFCPIKQVLYDDADKATRGVVDDLLHGFL